MTVTFTKNLRGVADLLLGDSTTTQAQTRDLLGTATAVNVQRIDSAVIPLSTAAKTLLSLTGTQYLDAAFTALASSVSVATTSTLGTVRISTAAAVPVALITDDPRVGYIPTSAQKDGLTGTPAEYTISGYTAPSTTNGYLTEGQTDAALYGTGRDGVFKVGAVAANATVSALAEVTSAGSIPAGTYNYKVTAGNASGETNVSAASSNIVLAGSTSAVTLTVPVNGDADCAWRKIYRSDNTGAGTYRLIGYIPDNTTTTFRDTLAYGGTAAPGSDTTAATWTVGVAGEFHWVGDVTLPALTLTGDLVIRATGTVTVGGAITGTGTGNGTSVLKPNTPSGSHGGTSLCVPGPKGFGSNVRALDMPSAGTSAGAPSTGSGVAGGAPGSVFIIYAHKIRIGANVTLNGAAGTSGASAAASNPGGGGGAGGIFACVARDTITAATVTVTTNGGNGGNGGGTGGGSTAYGGGAGGGGAFAAIAPAVDVSGVTHTKNAGTKGTASATATGSTAQGGQGGTCSGDGDGAMQTSVPSAPDNYRVATAGQTITQTSQPFALRI